MINHHGTRDRARAIAELFDKKTEYARKNDVRWLEYPHEVRSAPRPDGDGRITFGFTERVDSRFIELWHRWDTLDLLEVYAEEPFVRDTKSPGLLLCFAAFNGREMYNVPRNWRTGGCARQLKNVVSVTALGLDFDEGDVTLPGLRLRFEELGLECIIYSTFSHSAKKPKFRAIVSLRVPASLREREDQRLWRDKYHAFAEIVGAGVHDKACSDPTRLFYMPAHAPDAPYEWAYVEGAPLDYDGIVVPDKPVSRYVHLEDDAPASLREVEAALRHIPPCCDYPTWRNVIWAIHAQFFDTEDEDAARQICLRWSAKCRSKFDEDVFEKLWDDADPDGAIRLATFWMIALEHGYDSTENLISQLPNPNDLT